MPCAALDKNQEFHYTTGEKCVNLKTSAVSPELECHHHEADTRLFFHVSKMLSQCQNPIILDSGDTDVVAIASQAANELSDQMLLYRKGHLFDCQKMCSPELASVLVQLHAFTGADAISGFFGHGKVSVLEKVKRTPEFASLICDLGLQVELCSGLMQRLAKFTIKCVYRDLSSQSLAAARSSKWHLMKGRIQRGFHLMRIYWHNIAEEQIINLTFGDTFTKKSRAYFKKFSILHMYNYIFL